VVQIYEKVNAASLAALRPQFDWSASRFYALNAPGENYGVLLGGKRWVPDEVKSPGSRPSAKAEQTPCQHRSG